jgi:magnesium chelatase subunit I
LPEDIKTGGIDAVCPNCAEKSEQNESLTYMDRVRLIELPLNARMEDVVGGIDERAAVHNRLRLERGLLARADRNLLYVDEVNLLSDEIVDAILDAAAQGSYTVRRGPLSATYRARFVLIGSMNPEEGRLRPQILDRFGLRVFVRGLDSRRSRLEAYERAIAYQNNPREVVNTYADATNATRLELEAVRKELPSISLSKEAQRVGLKMIEELGIDSLRAEITLFEAARAHAVADGRNRATPRDVKKVAPMAIRLRRSHFIQDFFKAQQDEELEMAELLESFSSSSTRKAQTKKRGARKEKTGSE